MAETQQTAAGSVAADADQFAELLQKQFKPKTDGARSEVERAVKTLAEQALRETAVVSDDVVGTIKAIIAEIDKQLTDQINVILHSERFQQVESAWRGLHYLVNNTESDEMLKVRVLNISKKELGKTLKKYKAQDWNEIAHSAAFARRGCRFFRSTPRGRKGSADLSNFPAQHRSCWLPLGRVVMEVVLS